MPKPHGWTDEQLRRRDSCVERLKANGAEESRAYAICTAMVKKTSGKAKK